MLGGGLGFWITSIGFTVFGLCGAYMLLTREAQRSCKNKTQLSIAEKKRLKAWCIKRWSLFILYVIMLVVSCLIHSWPLALIAIALAVYAIILQFAGRCPNCGHRICYQNTARLPRVVSNSFSAYHSVRRANASIERDRMDG